MSYINKPDNLHFSQKWRDNAKTIKNKYEKNKKSINFFEEYTFIDNVEDITIELVNYLNKKIRNFNEHDITVIKGTTMQVFYKEGKYELELCEAYDFKFAMEKERLTFDSDDLINLYTNIAHELAHIYYNDTKYSKCITEKIKQDKIDKYINSLIETRADIYAGKIVRSLNKNPKFKWGLDKNPIPILPGKKLRKISPKIYREITIDGYGYLNASEREKIIDKKPSYTKTFVDDFCTNRLGIDKNILKQRVIEISNNEEELNYFLALLCEEK